MNGQESILVARVGQHDFVSFSVIPAKAACSGQVRILGCLGSFEGVFNCRLTIILGNVLSPILV